MAKVFLSYSREDAPAAKQLAECIGRAGHQVWWDRQIEGGSRFTAEIDRELKAADAVVVIWTRSSIESPWVQDEAAEGVRPLRADVEGGPTVGARGARAARHLRLSSPSTASAARRRRSRSEGLSPVWGPTTIPVRASPPRSQAS